MKRRSERKRKVKSDLTRTSQNSGYGTPKVVPGGLPYSTLSHPHVHNRHGKSATPQKNRTCNPPRGHPFRNLSSKMKMRNAYSEKFVFSLSCRHAPAECSNAHSHIAATVSKQVRFAITRLAKRPLLQRRLSVHQFGRLPSHIVHLRLQEPADSSFGLTRGCVRCIFGKYLEIRA